MPKLEYVDWGKVIRWSLAGVFVAFFVATIIFNQVSQTDEERYQVWNMNMTLGDPESPNHYIEYVDMMCPYCEKFNRAKNSGGFMSDYIDNGLVFYELRLTDLISDHVVNATRASEAGYCAARQGRGEFWRFYDNLNQKLFEDYYSKGIGDKKGAPEIPKLDDEYYLSVARENNVDADAIKTCFDEGKARTTLKANTIKAQNAGVTGEPYFIFNNYRSSGFDGTYTTVKMMMDAGLKK